MGSAVVCPQFFAPAAYCSATDLLIKSVGDLFPNLTSSHSVATWEGKMRYVILVILLELAIPVFAGEVIGNTYISEKDGTIEITTSEWDIKDTEVAGRAQIARLELKAAPESGFTGTVLVYRLSNFGGAVKVDTILSQLRAGVEKNGAKVGMLEPKRFAGKPVQVFGYYMEKDGGRADGQMYLVEGPKALYWLNCTANIKIWEHVRQKCDELMAQVKY